jgi:hypothetical protein
VKNKDQYGRNVAACSISPDLPFQQPEDMGTFLVSNGYAVAYRWARPYMQSRQHLCPCPAGVSCEVVTDVCNRCKILFVKETQNVLLFWVNTVLLVCYVA